jgi:DNA ligase-1
MGQRRRSNFLKSFNNIFNQINSVNVIEQTEVNLDEFTGEILFKKFNKNAVEQGYEGILVKDPDAVYECKRSTSWLKIKPSLTFDLTIVGVEAGTGKNEGKMGALICRGIDNNKEIEVNVGSGFTDAERDEFWNDREIIVGQIVEVRADAVTQNQDGTYSLRFPRFERFRGFAINEKI